MSKSRAQRSNYLRIQTVAAFIAGAALFHIGPACATELISVYIDQAKIVQLPENTSTIIIGNPVVADVTLLKKGSRMILTGKSFGSTNLIALDAAGNAVGESVIRVSATNKGLIVQRGMERESYDCSPRCHPTVSLGDSGKFMGETAGLVGQHSTIQRGK